MLRIDLDSDESLIQQLVRGIRAEIAAGTLQEGAELPPVRQLAGDLGINLNTVARAYRALQQSGLVHTARGRGTRVTAERELAGEAEASIQARLGADVQTVLTNAKLAGLERTAVEAILTTQLANLWPAEPA